MTKRDDSRALYLGACSTPEGTTGKDIQVLNRQIFSEWLPSNTQYEMGAPLNIEVYPCDQMDWKDKRWGIWLPVQPAHKA